MEAACCPVGDGTTRVEFRIENVEALRRDVGDVVQVFLRAIDAEEALSCCCCSRKRKHRTSNAMQVLQNRFYHSQSTKHQLRDKRRLEESLTSSCKNENSKETRRTRPGERWSERHARKAGALADGLTSISRLMVLRTSDRSALLSITMRPSGKAAINQALCTVFASQCTRTAAFTLTRSTKRFPCRNAESRSRSC